MFLFGKVFRRLVVFLVAGNTKGLPSRAEPYLLCTHDLAALHRTRT